MLTGFEGKTHLPSNQHLLEQRNHTAEQSVKNLGAQTRCNANDIAHTSPRYELWSAPGQI